MNLVSLPLYIRPLVPCFRAVLACAVLAAFSWGRTTSCAQDAAPSPSPVSTPTTDPAPTAAPTDTPSPNPVPSGTPQTTITPGVPDASAVAAYNAARTPLVDVTLGTSSPTPSSTTSNVVVGGTQAATSFRATLPSGACGIVHLSAPGSIRSKGTHTTSATSISNTQPVVIIVLTYDAGCAGQLVWVQMLRGGTLTADDGAGHIYDGSNGFYVTLDANAMATFNYQAPNTSGTYQVLTRLSNVVTTIPFLVPDPGF